MVAGRAASHPLELKAAATAAAGTIITVTSSSASSVSSGARTASAGPVPRLNLAALTAADGGANASPGAAPGAGPGAAAPSPGPPTTGRRRSVTIMDPAQMAAAAAAADAAAGPRPGGSARVTSGRFARGPSAAGGGHAPAAEPSPRPHPALKLPALTPQRSGAAIAPPSSPLSPLSPQLQPERALARLGSMAPAPAPAPAPAAARAAPTSARPRRSSISVMEDLEDVDARTPARFGAGDRGDRGGGGGSQRGQRPPSMTGPAAAQASPMSARPRRSSISVMEDLEDLSARKPTLAPLSPGSGGPSGAKFSPASAAAASPAAAVEADRGLPPPSVLSARRHSIAAPMSADDYKPFGSTWMPSVPVPSAAKAAAAATASGAAASAASGSQSERARARSPRSLAPRLSTESLSFKSPRPAPTKPHPGGGDSPTSVFGGAAGTPSAGAGVSRANSGSSASSADSPSAAGTSLLGTSARGTSARGTPAAAALVPSPPVGAPPLSARGGRLNSLAAPRIRRGSLDVAAAEAAAAAAAQGAPSPNGAPSARGHHKVEVSVPQPSERAISARASRLSSISAQPDRVPLPPQMRFYSKHEVMRFKLEFDACDDDGSGEVSLKELADFMARQKKEKDMLDHVQGLAVSRPQMLTPKIDPKASLGESLHAFDAWASCLLMYIDEDKSGVVEFAEYLMLHYPHSTRAERSGIAAWVTEEQARLRVNPPPPQLSAEQREDVQGVWEVYVRGAERPGELGRAELAGALLEAGVSDDPAEVDTIFSQFAGGKDHLTFDDFLALMAKSLLFKYVPPKVASRHAQFTLHSLGGRR